MVCTTVDRESFVVKKVRMWDSLRKLITLHIEIFTVCSAHVA